MTNQKRAISVAMAVAACLMFTTDAHAYLDPGTGSMMFQALAAVVIGGLAAVKIYWHRITGFFSGTRRQNKGDGSGPDNPQA